MIKRKMEVEEELLSRFAPPHDESASLKGIITRMYLPGLSGTLLIGESTI